MAFLVLAILCSTAISVFLRMSNNREHSLYGKLVCNYATCSLCALFFFTCISMEWNDLGIRGCQWVTVGDELILNAAEYETQWYCSDRFIWKVRCLCTVIVFGFLVSWNTNLASIDWYGSILFIDCLIFLSIKNKF